jgi:hypothetical protein
MYRALWAAPWLFLMICIPSYGHHAEDAVYKVKETATIEGKVLQFFFRNPHSFVQIRAAYPDGRAWTMEWLSAKKLRKQGIQKDTLRVGDVLTITGSPPRHANERRMLIRVVKRQSDGFVWGLRKYRSD